MDKLFEFVAPILPNFVALLCPDLEEKTETLQRTIGLLKSRKDDIDEELQNAACHSGKKRRREVEDWMNNVENIRKEFDTLEQGVQQSSRFYHVFKRQKLTEQLERMNDEVTKLVNRGDFPNGLFLDVDESIGQLLLTSQPNGQAFLQNLDYIWMSLMEVNVISIGIYGMGGVGKTTLAKRVHDKLSKESTFSGHVYWVTVSQEFSIYKLQSDIAQVLKLDIKDENEEGKRAAKLFQEFLKKERFVLILDDVWKQIDAEKIGIPSNRDGCKLVITSRSEEVCRRMCCKKVIKVNTLSYQEALDLFLKTVERDELSVEVEEICKKMVNRCHGLPLALITLAGSMRGVIDVHEWRDALEGLKESCLGQADMEVEVLPILMYSYHRLRDTRLRSCFLYCSLYPEDFGIERTELIGDFISEELMERRLSRQAEVDQGHAILNQLVRACLLESDSNGDLKMHDLIREMAIGITKDNPRYMVKAGLWLKELPEEQEWTEDLDKVSLMRNYIEEISPGTSPNCPSLSTLILRENPLRLIPDCFFTHMCGLHTLDLRETSIESLPNSISNLEKLKALLLGGCEDLVYVPPLEKLRALRQLDLAYTKIEEVPQGMESLTNLELLYMNCFYLEDMPAGILNRLSHLQELKLPYHVVSVTEVEGLKQLELFDGVLNSVSDLNRLIKFQQSEWRLNSYHIIINTPVYLFGDYFEPPCKVIHFGGDSLTGSSGVDVDLLPRDIEELLFEKSGLSCCLLDYFMYNAKDLKKCKIADEDNIECIMRLSSAEEEEQSRGVPFQSLEDLSLDELPNFIGLLKWEGGAEVALPPGTFSQLKMLRFEDCYKMKKLLPWSLVQNLHNLQQLYVSHCHGMVEIIGDDDYHYGRVAPIPPGPFSLLESLTIRYCDKIKKLFPQSLVHNFHKLRDLTVTYCKQIEEIIEDDNNEGVDITLPMLKKLTLKHLPQVKSICKGKMICDSIESISLVDIKNIKEFPLYLSFLNGQLSPPPCLQRIQIDGGDKEWWESLEWPHHNAKNILQPLVKDF